MFSIVAINDTDSRGQWEPLAPTKEAQEFHLSQTYHDGLVKLQAKEYDKARELLETVLKDPLISSAQVDSTASDGHLLQLRFLALKNLATVFLEQSPAYYDNALHCYLQAVEIDSKDSVVWNQLGTLSCSMGLLSISRWAFEQGLSCSPNNWNCMEKLLEVLIAIGDEVACLSIAELILRHWPSHSRALHVKNAIEETESIPFTPRGIDKLEPKHVRLKFPEKRKAEDNNLAEEITFKKLKQNIELNVTEATWTAFAGALLGFLMPPCESGSEASADKSSRSRDVRLSILLPQRSENVLRSAERKARTFGSDSGCSSIDDLNSDKGSISREKEAIAFEDQPQERRSSRLERLRSRKPDKDEMEFATSKDLAKVVLQFLQPYVLERAGTKDSNDAYCSFSCADVAMNPLDAELNDVTIFVNQTSKNYGAYHVGHLLLEEVAWKGIVYQNDLVRFLELEKLTRHWGKDRTPECSLFLAELYYDFGSHYSDAARASDFMLEASYHLCKVIEAVALDYPFNVSGDETCSSVDDHQGYCATVMRVSSLLGNKRSFWVRYYWLSGQLSIFYGNKEKAQEQFYFSSSLLTNETNTNGSLGLVSLPHCKFIKELTSDTVLHEINIIDIDLLLKKTIPDMIEKNMHLECINLLAPLLFSTKGIHHDMSCVTDKGEEINSVELSALDVLIQACVKTKTMDTEIYLKSRLRRLRILMFGAGIEECFASCKKFHQISSSRTSEPKESTNKHWNHLVAEEVKAISQSVSKLKNFIFPYGESDCLIVKMKIIGEIQSLLIAIMCNIANAYFSKKSVGIGILDKNEERQKCCFVEAAIAFCKLQHLNPHVLIKAQIELLAAMHDMLAEYGICCAAGDGEEEEGTFLKFAIKHLLALDMKLKSNLHPLNKGLETSQSDENLSQNNHVKRREQICDDINIKRSPNEPKLDILDANVHYTCTDENRIIGMYPVERINSNIYSSHGNLENDQKGGECCKHVVEGPHALHGGEQSSNHFLEFENELTDEEREELELSIDNALDQCFFCLYGLNLRSESSYEDDISLHKNTSRGDYQTKEQCADVFQYILPYAKGSSRTGLVKLRRVLRAIRKHFPKPPDDVLAGNTIDKFLDDPNLCENKLSEEAGSDGFLDSIMKIFSDTGSLKQQKVSPFGSSEPYLEVYCNLYYLLAQSEEMNATDKWAGFVLTKEGEEFVEQNAKLFKYDLLYNPLRFESWQRLANIYDEEVDLLLNDGSKQINVEGWRKNASFPQRVETSRRSRRCLLMTLAIARTAVQQGEIHELLALVYYDGVQNVVPFYDQRSIGPSRDAVWEMFCRNSMRHFKKAFAHKKDWSHAYYLGKLCEKLGYSHDISFSYYDKAMTLNPSAVDPFYRMHASRLKLLNKCGKQNEQALKVVAAYSFNQSTKETVMTIFERMGAAITDLPIDVKDDGADANADDKTQVDLNKLEEVWNMLYDDCLSALEICVEGDLKHFHKARYMLSQGLYRRGESGDIEKAKEELSFCFKSTRSCFTFNMWEIDGTVRKGKRKTPGVSGNRKVLEVNLSESSRKFITCIRKYILFYLKLLELTGDISTLDRAYISIRSDKRFNLCLEDLVPVALGRYINALIFCLHQTDTDYDVVGSCVEHLLEKMFSLYLEQMNLWSDLYSLPDISSPDLTESSLYGYLNQYVQLLERNAKLETLEGINEKLRKRLKNPKLSNSNCTKVYKHVSFAWCQTLVISMALITPLHTRISSDIQVPNLSDSIHENAQLLCVDMQTDELWNSSFEDPNHLKSLEAKWNPILCKIKNVIIKKASDEDLDTAAILLRSSYNFYKDTSCAMLPSGINLYTVPSQLAAETYIQPAIDGVDILDMSTPRKLLLWAYTLLHGHCANISAVVKYCEENVKSKMRKGTGSLLLPSNTSLPTSVPSQTGDGKDGMGKCSESNSASVTTVITSSLLGPEHSHDMVDTPMAQTGSLSSQASASLSDTENLCAPSVTFPETENAFNMLAPSLLKSTSIHVPYSTNSSVSHSNAQDLLHCNNNATDGNVGVVQGGDVPDKG